MSNVNFFVLRTCTAAARIGESKGGEFGPNVFLLPDFSFASGAGLSDQPNEAALIVGYFWLCFGSKLSGTRLIKDSGKKCDP